jgi:hypothetical protein
MPWDANIHLLLEVVTPIVPVLAKTVGHKETPAQQVSYRNDDPDENGAPQMFGVLHLFTFRSS